MSGPACSVLVTVGTTEFDELMMAIDNAAFATACKNLHINKLSVQIGRGIHEPNVLVTACKSMGIDAIVYRYKPDLEVDIKAADLIISHCGAGSILEAVKYNKPLIVVINESLQDNHQTELADAMTSSGYCSSAIPRSLLQILCNEFSTTRYGFERSTQSNTLNDIPINDPNLFCKVLDSMFSFSS